MKQGFEIEYSALFQNNLSNRIVVDNYASLNRVVFRSIWKENLDAIIDRNTVAVFKVTLKNKN